MTEVEKFKKEFMALMGKYFRQKKINTEFTVNVVGLITSYVCHIILALDLTLDAKQEMFYLIYRVMNKTLDSKRESLN